MNKWAWISILMAFPVVAFAQGGRGASGAGPRPSSRVIPSSQARPPGGARFSRGRDTDRSDAGDKVVLDPNQSVAVDAGPGPHYEASNAPSSGGASGRNAVTANAPAGGAGAAGT